jgi:RNA polymerase sigma factor (TIGR02999 family)
MYVRLFGAGGTAWEDRRHFLSVASRAMRSILVDYARRKGRKKRTPVGDRVPLEAIGVDLGDRTVNVLDLDEALTDLAKEDERAARVVECRFFGQYTMSEISLLLDVPKRTVERDWTFARLWLKRYLDR